MTYTYNRKGITRKVLSEIVRGLGQKILQIPPLRQPKDSGNAKCSWHVCASCHYDVSSFSDIFTVTALCPRKSFLGWGVVAGSC